MKYQVSIQFNIDDDVDNVDDVDDDDVDNDNDDDVVDNDDDIDDDYVSLCGLDFDARDPRTSPTSTVRLMTYMVPQRLKNLCLAALSLYCLLMSLFGRFRTCGVARLLCWADGSNLV